MKYKDLTERKFDYTGFRFICSHWDKKSTQNLSNNRGAPGAKYHPVIKHEICTTPGILFGEECVYESTGDKGRYFIYPVSELERTGQLTEQDLNTPTYEIY